MRAGPLSNPKIIELLNAHFIPVYAVNEDYRDNSKPADERAVYDRIYRETLEKKLSAGTVHVYLVGADGRVFDSMHVAEAAKTEKLLATLERAIRNLKIPAGKVLVAPQPQSKPPKISADALLLHLTARGIKGGGYWGGPPSENWIVLANEEWSKLLPTNKPIVGNTWTVDSAVTENLYRHFYPQNENNKITTNRIDEKNLRATTVSVEKGIVRAKLEGNLRMKHSFYPGRSDQNVVEATMIGYLDFDFESKTIRALRLVTDRATYGGGEFGVAVRSIP